MEHWLRATVGVGLFMALLGLLSLAVGTLLRHSAGAITTMIGVVLLPFVLAIGLYAESLAELRTWLVQYSIPSQLAVLYSGQADYTGTPSGWDPLWIMAGVTAVALAGAYAALTTRDVQPPASVAGALLGPLHLRGAAVLRVPARLVPVPPVVHAAVLRARRPRAPRRAGSPGRSRGSGSASPPCRRPPRAARTTPRPARSRSAGSRRTGRPARRRSRGAAVRPSWGTGCGAGTR